MQRFFSKLETWVFYLFIFTIPFETRLIVARWTQPFNEWTAGFVYGTDILIFLLFVFWIVRVLKTRSSGEVKSAFAETLKLRWSNPNLWLVAFFVVSAFSILNSRIIGLSLYQLLKLAEFIGFYFYFRSGFGRVFKFQQLLTVIIASGVFQALVAIIQYLRQGSAGLRLLGESPLSVNTTGVAVFVADGAKYLRAYGTTPHPNVLAAWLFVAIFAFYIFYFAHRQNSPSETRRTSEIFPFICYPLLLMGFFFSFSRTIIGLWGLGVVVGMLLLLRKFRGLLLTGKKQFAAISMATIITAGLFVIVFWPQVWSRVRVSMGEEAVTQRIFYNKIAEGVATTHPLLGVGIGQFVPQLMSNLKHLPAYFFQPVHNIYLLIASETGLIGLALFLLFLFFLFWSFVRRADLKKPCSFSFLLLAFSFLLMGLFDHFLWTLQQGSLIFWMIIAFISLSPQFQNH